MSAGIRRRLAAAVSAAVCAAVIGVLAPPSAHAIPAYNPGPIAFGTGYTPNWTIVDINTHQRRTVTPSGGGFNASMDVTYVKYSPNAQQVAFLTGDPVTNENSRLWVASADGANAHPIASGATGPIAWSPDGTQILYGADGIQAIPVDGRTPPKLVIAPPDPRCSTEGPSRVTSHNTVFFWQDCQAEGGRLLLGFLYAFSPGGVPWATSFRYPVFPGFSVAPDGSRIARVAPNGNELWVTVQQIGDENTLAYSYGTAHEVLRVGPVDFGLSDELAIASQSTDGNKRYNEIQVVANRLYPTPRTIVSDFAGDDSHPITFLDWLNGSSNLPVRPIADRIGGTDRIATAIDASQWAFDTRGAPGRRATVAVLARDDLYPDALVGTALAIQRGGPLLLTSGRSLDPRVGLELARVLSPGSTVYLLGGPAALSPGIADQVQQLGYHPLRLGGRDRYDTAVLVDTAIPSVNIKATLVATGTNFADALTASVAAGQDRYSLYSGASNPAGSVVLLTDGATLPAATLAYINGHGGPLYAVGGPAAAALRSTGRPAGSWTALVGSDRYDTAAKVATSALYGNGAPGRYTMAAITTGTDFPDAMSGGALAGSQDAPLLLAGPGGLSPAENAILRNGHRSDIAVIGGPAAVSDHVLASAADVAFGPYAWDTFTNRAAPPLR